MAFFSKGSMLLNYGHFIKWMRGLDVWSSIPGMSRIKTTSNRGIGYSLSFSCSAKGLPIKCTGFHEIKYLLINVISPQIWLIMLIRKWLAIRLKTKQLLIWRSYWILILFQLLRSKTKLRYSNVASTIWKSQMHFQYFFVVSIGCILCRSIKC